MKFLKKLTPKKTTVLFYIFVILALGVHIFVTSPNLSIMFLDGAVFWVILISTCILAPFIIKLAFNGVSILNDPIQTTIKLIPKKVVVIIACLWGLIFVVEVIFNPLFFYNSYRSQIADVEETIFTSEIQAIDLNQIPIVDKALASRLADKKLGEDPSLGSQVDLGEPTLQNVNGELLWIVPLQHSGFFKWLANLEGSAGYITVSATDQMDVQYVNDYKIKIQPTSYLLHDLTRLVRLNGGLFTGITDYSFEIDNTGKPYWVVTTYTNTCGFNLPEATGIILVDAQDGDVQRYGMDEIPDWVDRVQPEEFILQQLENKGEYVHGVFNFSNKNKFQPTYLHNIVYNDDRCYLLTGITSVGSDQSATGFYMIDMVTKEPILYRISGATELSAKGSAEGEVSDLKYVASNPILLNVFETPTYFMTLQDSAGLIKRYAFVSVTNYQIVGLSSTISEARADYYKKLTDANQGSGDFNISGDQPQIQDYLTIDRISYTIEDSLTFYMFTTKEKPGVLFKADLRINPFLVLTQAGDEVEVVYSYGDDNMQVIDFKNATL